MDKFEKKIRKITGHPENAIVVGKGFGMFSSMLSTHNTIFKFNSTDRGLKVKNLIYRESFDHLDQLYEIRVIYFDLDMLHLLENFRSCWTKDNSMVIIEGGEPIGREFSKPLYDTGWGCTIVEKHFHVWTKIK